MTPSLRRLLSFKEFFGTLFLFCSKYGRFHRMISYNCIKIIHIMSAALLMLALIHSYLLWRPQIKKEIIADRIHKITWYMVIPVGLFQLLTGFMMMSLQHYDYSEIWIKGSTISFAMMMISWMGFNYCLISSSRRKQTIFLHICLMSLLSMIFFMSSRVA